jgi:hypothetical protein
MEDIRSIIERVAAGTPAHEAIMVPPAPMQMDLPHGWKDSEASGSRVKVLFNPVPKYKRHIVRLDTKTGSWSHQGPGGYDVRGRGDLHDYLNSLHGKVVREALDPDSAGALRPRGIKRAGPAAQPAERRPKREPVNPVLKKRATDWSRYRTQNPEETPERHGEMIRSTLAAHGFQQAQWPTFPGVESYQHPDHPGHVVHYLSGPNRPEGAPDGSWYHHDQAMVAHNSGHDKDSLDTHLGQFFGTGPQGPRMDVP